MCNTWPAEECDNWGNDYSTTVGQVRDYAKCRKVGFKNVQARMFYCGRYGFLSHDPGGRFDRVADPVISEGSCFTHTETEQPSHDTTKYLKMVATMDYVQTNEDRGLGYGPGPSFDCEFSRGMQVTKYGVSIQTDCSESGTGLEFARPVLKLYINAGYAIGGMRYTAYLDHWTAIGCTVTFTRPSFHEVECEATHPTLGAAGSFLYNANTGAFSGSYCAEDGDLVFRTMRTDNFTCSNTGWSWAVTDENYGTYHTSTAYTITVTLSVPYTEAEFQGDLYTLLGHWDMNDDIAYPWRSDGYLSIAPLVTINQYPGGVQPELYVTEGESVILDGIEDCAFVDPGADLYDGSVVGAPLPHGYGPHFDYHHKTWRWCYGSDEEWHPYIYSYGAWSGGPITITGPGSSFYDTGDTTDTVIPIAATQWTENYCEFATQTGGVIDGWAPGNLPGGAWSKFDGVLGWCQKWVEAKVMRPSYNFARPCGVDRALPDETTVTCAYNADGWEFDTAAGVTAESGDLVMLCGVDGILDGVYVVDSHDITYSHFVLNSTLGRVGLVDPDRDCGSGIMGVVRFPGAPALCESILVTAATQDGITVTITLDAPARYLRVSDYVDFTDVGGLGTNVAVTSIISTTQFTVTGTLSPSTYAGGGRVSSNGAAADYWNDARVKGDYLWATWTMHGRDWQERARVITQYEGDTACDGAPAGGQIRENIQGLSRDTIAMTFGQACAIWDACQPVKLGCVPLTQEDTTDWANNMAFGSIKTDGRYGFMWQADYFQHWDDYLWQAPAPICVVDTPFSPWVEDPGNCTGDYPFPPQIEARAEIPDNAGLGGDESPPVGQFRRVYTYAELLTADPLPNIILAPRVGEGYIEADGGNGIMLPKPQPATWVTYFAEEQCVCESGALAADYIKQGVKCPS